VKLNQLEDFKTRK